MYIFMYLCWFVAEHSVKTSGRGSGTWRNRYVPLASHGQRVSGRHTYLYSRAQRRRPPGVVAERGTEGGAIPPPLPP